VQPNAAPIPVTQAPAAQPPVQSNQRAVTPPAATSGAYALNQPNVPQPNVPQPNIPAQNLPASSVPTNSNPISLPNVSASASPATDPAAYATEAFARGAIDENAAMPLPEADGHHTDLSNFMASGYSGSNVSNHLYSTSVNKGDAQGAQPLPPSQQQQQAAQQAQQQQQSPQMSVAPQYMEKSSGKDAGQSGDKAMDLATMQKMEAERLKQMQAKPGDQTAGLQRSNSPANSMPPPTMNMPIGEARPGSKAQAKKAALIAKLAKSQTDVPPSSRPGMKYAGRTFDGRLRRPSQIDWTTSLSIANLKRRSRRIKKQVNQNPENWKNS
jgi:hypothetical protein